jgi:hypothetical protein
MAPFQKGSPGDALLVWNSDIAFPEPGDRGKEDEGGGKGRE